LGEGKPENQNHAIIFTRGEGLQTIDMNQVFCIIYAYMKKGKLAFEKQIQVAKFACNRITIWKKPSR